MINDLISIGLTENESKAYLALLQGNQFSASELAKRSKVNKTKIYFVLECLIKKGFCDELPGKFRTFKAKDPIKAMNKLIDLHYNNLQTAKRITKILAQSYNCL